MSLRKFLIKSTLPWYSKIVLSKSKKISICTTYLLEYDRQLNKPKYTLIKNDISYYPNDKKKYEHFYSDMSDDYQKIDYEEYNKKRKLQDPERYMLDKERNTFKFNQVEYHLDIYRSYLDGLIILESNADGLLSFPPHMRILKEVTTDANFYPFNLATFKSFDRSILRK